MKNKILMVFVITILMGMMLISCGKKAKEAVSNDVVVEEQELEEQEEKVEPILQTEEQENIQEYMPGVYSSSIMLNGNAVDIVVTLEKNEIVSIRMEGINETIATMYPLLELALDNLTEQILVSQSLEDITNPEENKYTSRVLLDAIEQALDKAVESEDETGMESRDYSP